MKYQNKLILFFFLLPFLSFGQTNFKPGYVVTLKGDTVRGFIDYKEWYKNPKYISFKQAVSDNKAGRFSTQNINAFAVTGLEYYQRFIVAVSQDNVDINHLAQKPDTSSITDTVFLKIDARGKYLTLFRYNDDLKTRFYILEAGETQPKELIYRAYYNHEESESIVYINRYRTQLVNLAQKLDGNNGKISRQILLSKYSENELTKIVQILNGNPSKQFTSQNLAGIRLFAGAGVNYSTFKFDDPRAVFNRDNSSASVFPKINAGIDFFENRNTQALLLRAEYSFTVNQYKFSQGNDAAPVGSTYNLAFTQYTNSISPQIIFNFYNRDDLKVFAGIGASLNFTVYNSYKFVTKYDSPFPETDRDRFPALRSFWLSVPITAGVQLSKKMEINIRYAPKSTLSNDGGFSGGASSFQAGVNYLFGK